MIKKGLLNQLKTIGEMFIFNIISAVLFSAAYIGTKTESVGSVWNGWMLPMEQVTVELNLYYYIFSLSLLLLLNSVFWIVFLRKRLLDDLKTHIAFSVSFCILTIIFFAVELFIFIFESLSKYGLFRENIHVNDAGAFDIFFMCMFVLVPIVTIIYTIIKNKKVKRK